jgi:hypothetical protein
MEIYPTNLKIITHQLRNMLSNIRTIQGEVFLKNFFTLVTLIFWLVRPIRAGEQKGKQKGGKNSKQTKAENELKIFVHVKLLQKGLVRLLLLKKAQPLAKFTP